MGEKPDSTQESTIVPAYYRNGRSQFDVIEFCWILGIGFLQGNVIKYVVRYSEKNGLEDLYKAREYLRRLIEFEERKRDGEGN